MPVGTLHDYSVFKGPVLSLVYTAWTYKSQYYVQTLELPNNSEVMKLKFKLFAQSGDEIFLRFHYLEHPEDWFYVFNSADIRLKKMFKPRTTLYGENQYPAVGGILIGDKDKHPLQIFPKFPLGVGMVDDQTFQLHLHRNTPNSDKLGIEGPLSDPYPVEHDFLITIGDLDFTRLWKNYLLHKHSPIVFGVTSFPSDISLDLGLQKTWKTQWNTETEYSLSREDICVYLSSVVVRLGKKYARVLNVCDTPQVLHLDGYVVGKEVLINENQIPESRNEVPVDGSELFWYLNENSGESVIKYSTGDEEGMICPYCFKAYELRQEVSWRDYFS